MNRSTKLALITTAMASWAVASAPAQTAKDPKQGVVPQSASVPDFSGLWSHPYLPGFEPPASGPGPVTNRSRIRGGPQPEISNTSQYVGDYTDPILKPWAAEVLKKRGEVEIGGAHSPTQ